jgi:hypothetical protein
MRAADFRMARLVQDGLLYTPVRRAGEIVDQAQLDALAATIDEKHCGVRRLIRFILLDESTPRSAAGFPAPPNGIHRVSDYAGVRLERFKVPSLAFLPVSLIGDGSLPVGILYDITSLPPGSTPGTTGRHWIATAVLANTMLADIAWRAIRTGVLEHVSALMTSHDVEDGYVVDGIVGAVKLCPSEHACLPSARILELAEEARDVPGRSLDECFSARERARLTRTTPSWAPLVPIAVQAGKPSHRKDDLA